MATRFTREAQARFLARFAETGNVTDAARHAGVPRQQIYHRNLANDRFRAAFMLARDAALDRLRGEAIRRARDGVEEPLLQGGSVVTNEYGLPVTTRRYSDRLLVYMIKRLTSDGAFERF